MFLGEIDGLIMVVGVIVSMIVGYVALKLLQTLFLKGEISHVRVLLLATRNCNSGHKNDGLNRVGFHCQGLQNLNVTRKFSAGGGI